MKYTTKELCELILKINPKYFKGARKQAALKKLRLMYDVIEEKDGRTNYFTLTPKNGLLNILQCKIGNKDINVIEMILKSIMDNEIVPIQSEFARITGLAQSTVSGYITFLQKNEIIIPPATETIIKRDEDTGYEISRYEKKMGTYIYYETKNGSVIKLDEKTQEMAHNMYGKSWAVEYAKVINPLLQNGIQEKRLQNLKGLIKRNVWLEIEKACGLNKCNRIMKPIISLEIRQQLKEYFKQAS